MICKVSIIKSEPQTVIQRKKNCVNGGFWPPTIHMEQRALSLLPQRATPASLLSRTPKKYSLVILMY